MTFPRYTAFALLALLSGCSSIQETIYDWTNKDRNQSGLPAKLTDFKEQASITVRWHQSIGDAGNAVLLPAVTADAVYAGDAKGELYRFDKSSGKQLWRVDSGFVQTGGIGAGEGLVLVGGVKGELAAFKQNGQLGWKVKVSSEVTGVPQVAQGIVVVRTGDGRIVGLSAADGKQVWSYQRATPALIVRSHAGVAIQRDAVFAGFAGGKLASLDIKTGTVNWEAVVSQPRGNTELERISDITSDPVVDDEQVCATSFQGHLACFDIEQGSLLWSRDISSDKGLTLLRKYLYVSDAAGSVIALDKSSGSTIWKNTQLSLRRTSVPGVQGNYLLVGDLDGYLHALSREDGSFAARIKADGNAIAAAAIELDGGLLVQTSGGGLYSVDIH
ncbi:MAG: outer membrane protein assembly factor BamB [Nitrosomonadales bacterium]|nr:outer membrane protein assembly factor BamB [Nitrosomonadales bacterium]